MGISWLQTLLENALPALLGSLLTLLGVWLTNNHNKTIFEKQMEEERKKQEAFFIHDYEKKRKLFLLQQRADCYLKYMNFLSDEIIPMLYADEPDFDRLPKMVRYINEISLLGKIEEINLTNSIQFTLNKLLDAGRAKDLLSYSRLLGDLDNLRTEIMILFKESIEAIE